MGADKAEVRLIQGRSAVTCNQVVNPDRVIQVNLQCFPVAKACNLKSKSDGLGSDTSLSEDTGEQKVL